MNPTPLASVLAAAALALAGCLAPAAAPETQASPSPNAPAPAAPTQGGAPDALAAASAGLPTLYMTPELGFAAAPPGQETRVALDTPVNGPTVDSYPSWQGTLPHGLEAPRNLTVVFYVSANTASMSARHVPVFADLPGFFLEVQVGGARYEGQVEGPHVLLAGEVHEVTATLAGGKGQPVEAGAPVSFSAAVIYTHVTGAAEFQYVMGPQHPARVVLADGASSP